MIVLTDQQASEIEGELHKARKLERSARKTLQAFRFNEAEVKQDAMAGACAVAGSAASGFAHGLGYLEPWGVPMDLLVGLGLNIAARLEQTSSASSLVAKNFGNGALGYYLGRHAFHWGRDLNKDKPQAQAAAFPPAASMASLPPVVASGAMSATPGPLSNDELAELIHATVERHHLARAQGFTR